MLVNIQPYMGDFEDLIPLLKMAIGTDSSAGVRRLVAVEQARETRYFTANLDGQIAGVIGVFVDESGEIEELEPPQIIDIAVLPAHQRSGIARALMAHAETLVRAAGRNRLWLYTDGNNPGLLAFYRRLGFRLVSAVPDYFGDGTVKAIFRKDL